MDAITVSAYNSVTSLPCLQFSPPILLLLCNSRLFPAGLPRTYHVLAAANLHGTALTLAVAVCRSAMGCII